MKSWHLAAEVPKSQTSPSPCPGMQPASELATPLGNELSCLGAVVTGGVDATMGSTLIHSLLGGKKPWAVVWGSPHPNHFSGTRAVRERSDDMTNGDYKEAVFEFLCKAFVGPRRHAPGSTHRRPRVQVRSRLRCEKTTVKPSKAEPKVTST